MKADEGTLAALLRASTVITAIVVRSLTSVSPQVTVVQARVLVIVWRLGTANLSTVAAGLAANASNASRTCDRLVRSGLLSREQADADRRHVVLRLSPEGQRLVDSVMQHRGAELERIVSRLSPAQQTELRRAIETFNAAADEVDAGPDGLLDHHLLSWMS
jgi:DNA-binding MarR family transcriptional regulator